MTLYRATVRRRPNTPPWLAEFAFRLYGRCCIRCGASRPLQVAHLVNWRTTNRILPSEPMPTPGGVEDLARLFHRTLNVVVLCASCHALFDGRRYTDVTIETIIEARDRVLGTSRAGLVVREYFSRGFLGEMGTVAPGTVNLERWAPMLRWMRAHLHRGLLPEPHRFRLGNGIVVDVRDGSIGSDDEADAGLPYWSGTGFAHESDPGDSRTS